MPCLKNKAGFYSRILQIILNGGLNLITKNSLVFRNYGKYDYQLFTNKITNQSKYKIKFGGVKV
jgi:hypothetical protein